MSGMTVQELRTLLEEYPDDMQVMIAAPSHDYLNTTVARPVDDNRTDEVGVTWSEYHEAYVMTEDDDAEFVVVIGI